MLKEIDIGHAGQNSSNAISDLEVVQKDTQSNLYYGKVAKEVRRWAKEQTGRFRGVINGEDYDMFNRDAVDMRSDFLSTKDEDFNRRNPGITIIWL